MKLYGVFALIVIVGLSVVSALNTTFGAIKPGDVKLRVEKVSKDGKLLHIVKLDYRYGYNKTNRNIISAIKIVDLIKNNNGGNATILSGGPGARNVTLRFKSKRGQGLKFQVYIYGKNVTRGNVTRVGK